jgi:hypothetical protein
MKDVNFSLFQSKYIKYGNLLSSPFSFGSWIWNGIKATVPFIAKNACFLPCKFSNLPIWTSPWIPILLHFIPTPRLPYFTSYPLAISDLLLPSTAFWNSTLLFFFFNPSTIIEILKIVLSPLHDLVLWTPTNSAFSTKSAHHLITSSIPVTPFPFSKSHWKALWKLNLNHRLKLFLWKMVWNIIPTKFHISQTINSSPNDTSCSICSFPIDFILHLFFSCPIARVVWHQSFWPLDSLALPVHDITDWLLILNPATIGIPQTTTHMFQIFVAVACDQLWFSRNKAHHNKLVPNALTISATINNLVLEHHSAWSSSLIRNPEVWQKPCSPFYKVNYDTAIRPSFSAK